MKYANKVKLHYLVIHLIFTVSIIMLATKINIVNANELLMMRSTQEFPETMASLQRAIKSSGNTLSRIQRIDIGLSKMGYQTDKYRVVFYGKQTEIKSLSKNFPELIPYLPLKIAIFSENGQTVLTATNPAQLSKMYPNKKLKALFLAWTKDLKSILAQVQHDSDSNVPFNSKH